MRGLQEAFKQPTFKRAVLHFMQGLRVNKFRLIRASAIKHGARLSAAVRIIERLDGVRTRGPNQWVARCPAHEDRSPSLSIRETSTGNILVYDFGGCDTHSVLAALGLTVGDLFAEPFPDVKPGKPNHWHARKEAFETIHRECLLVAIAGETLAAGVTLSLDDRNRLCFAATRIRSAVEVCR
jgi:hypothetical protein